MNNKTGAIIAVCCGLISVKSYADEIGADRLGCLHRTVAQCLSSFGQVLSDADRKSVNDGIAENANKVDVNGRHIGSNEIELLPTIDGNLTITTLTLNSKNEIIKIAAHMKGGLDSAQTTEDYDATGLFDTLQILLGKNCVNDKPELYKFFHNKVSPRLSRTKRSTDWQDTSVSVDYTRHVRNIKYCTASLDLDSVSGIDTSLISEYNSDGNYHYDELTLR